MAKLETHLVKDFSELGKAVTFEAEFLEPKRGEVYFASLSDMSIGNTYIKSKDRPITIIQNDIGNRYSNTVVVALMTTSDRKLYPSQYEFNLNNSYSKITFEQILTIDKSRLLNKIGELSYKQMKEADEKLMFSLGLQRFSLSNILDFNVINRTQVKTRTEEFISFNFQFDFINDKLITSIKLDKLQEFNKDINADINFDELKQKLDCMRGLNWLVNNNDL